MQIILGKILVEYVKYLIFFQILEIMSRLSKKIISLICQMEITNNSKPSHHSSGQQKNGSSLGITQKLFPGTKVPRAEVNPPLAQSYPASRQPYKSLQDDVPSGYVKIAIENDHL